MKSKFNYLWHNYGHKIVILILAIIFVGIGMVGTVLPAFTKPADRGYMALQGFVDDYVGYVSYIKEGMYGANYFKIRSIPPPQPFSTVHLLYVWFGKIGGFVRWDAPFTYHFFRALLGLGLIFYIYLLMCRMFKNKIDVVIATFLSTTATSLGWYVWDNGKFFYKTLATFWFVNNDALRFTNRPHYLAGAILFLVISIQNINSKSQKKVSTVLGVFIYSIVLGMVHPSFAVMLACISALMVVWRAINYRNIKEIASSYLSTGAGLVIGMGISYWFMHQYPTVWVLSFEEYVLLENLDWNRIFSDIITFGPCLWIGAVGMVLTWFTGKKNDEKHFYMMMWLIVQMLFFFVFYKYFRSERVRYIQSLYFIPMGYGTASLLKFIGSHLRNWIKAVVAMIIFLTMLPTLINGTIASLSVNTNYSYYQYFIFPTKNMIAAYNWLDRYSPKESTVIAAYEAANNIIIYSHNYVVGNKQGWPALEGERMEKEKEQFFEGTWDENTTHEYLRSRNISYVYQGYQETKLFLKYPFYEEVYHNPEVVIYKVKI
jgi:hypothetical protein